MDELEREEFFRLKKVQAKKKRDAADKDSAVIEVRTKQATAVEHAKPCYIYVLVLHMPLARRVFLAMHIALSEKLMRMQQVYAVKTLSVMKQECGVSSRGICDMHVVMNAQ